MRWAAHPVLGLTLLTFLSEALPVEAIESLTAQSTLPVLESSPNADPISPNQVSPNQVTPQRITPLTTPTSPTPGANPQTAPQFTGPLPDANTPPPPQSEAPYSLGAGDRIRIDIFQVPQYSGENDVLIDGSLNLPLVGTVPVNGLTIEEATATISARYAQFLRRPIVTVSLISRRPLQIGVAGEVQRPGSYAVPQEGGDFPTLTQLIQAAGGITQSADIRQVQVRRPQSSGGEEIINVDLWQLLQTGNLGYDVALRDGDTIYIPTGTTVDLAEAPIIAASTFASNTNEPINIAVVGEVFRPGSYTAVGGAGQTGAAGETGVVSGGNTAPTVTRAIQLAGGIKPMADVRNVQIRRLTRTGEEQTFEVDLWALLEGDQRQDAILQEGDTIVVPMVDSVTAAEATALATTSFSPDSIRINVVGEVDNPGTIALPPGSTLNQAVLAAGGFNSRARPSSVDLVRLNPDGTVSRQEIDVDFSQGIDAANNPLLQNNDVVIIGRNDLASISDTLDLILSPLGSAFSIFQLPFRFLNLFE